MASRWALGIEDGQRKSDMPRIYHGWFVVAACTAIYTLVMGTIYTSYGLFVVPVSQEFGLSRANANSGIIILNVGVALLSPFMGRLLDNISAKRIMIVSSLVFMLSFALLAWSRSLWISAAVLALLLPFAAKGAGTLTAPLLVVRWFTAQRGRAMAISQLGLSMGGLVVAPLVGFLLLNYGWRMAVLVAGVGTGAILLTISLLIRERPGPNDREPGAALSPEKAAARGAQPTVAQARLPVGSLLANGSFWAINLSCGLVSAIASALLITLPPLAAAHHLSVIQGATLISAMSVSGVLAKLALAGFADRIDKILLLTVMFLLGAGINALLMNGQSYLQLLIGAAGVGLVSSAVTPVHYALLADRFGAPSFGTVTGLTVPLIAVLGVATIRYSGEIFDRTGAYDWLFLTFMILQAAAAVTILSVRRFKTEPTLAVS